MTHTDSPLSTPKLYFAGYSCTCCALAHVNDDTSGCENSCTDHSDLLAEWGTDPGETVVVDVDTDAPGVFRCVGCGNDSYGDAHRVTIIEARS